MVPAPAFLETSWKARLYSKPSFLVSMYTRLKYIAVL